MESFRSPFCAKSPPPWRTSGHGYRRVWAHRDDAVQSVLVSVEGCGFGYAAYPGAEKRGDGLSISLREWVDDRLAGAGLEPVLAEEGGWGGHQDVFTVVRQDAVGP